MFNSKSLIVLPSETAEIRVRHIGVIAMTISKTFGRKYVAKAISLIDRNAETLGVGCSNATQTITLRSGLFCTWLKLTKRLTKEFWPVIG